MYNFGLRPNGVRTWPASVPPLSHDPPVHFRPLLLVSKHPWRIQKNGKPSRPTKTPAAGWHRAESGADSLEMLGTLA